MNAYFPFAFSPSSTSRRMASGYECYCSEPVPRLLNCKLFGVRGVTTGGRVSSYFAARSKSRFLMKGSLAFSAKPRTVWARSFLNSSLNMTQLQLCWRQLHSTSRRGSAVTRTQVASVDKTHEFFFRPHHRMHLIRLLICMVRIRLARYCFRAARVSRCSASGSRASEYRNDTPPGLKYECPGGACLKPGL